MGCYQHCILLYTSLLLQGAGSRKQGEEDEEEEEGGRGDESQYGKLMHKTEL